MEHAQIDLDQSRFASLLKARDWAAAKVVYQSGVHSTKSPSFRTLAGFSTGAAGKMSGEALFMTYSGYWGVAAYADAFVTAAVDGVATATPMLDAAGAADVAREEMANKGSAYQSVWMYTIHEFEDAIGDCGRASIADNDAGVHAWDEGVAFYTGSAQTLPTPDGQSDGFLLYQLAQKRCGNFGTCGADGVAIL